jgi:hypothetical protein
MELPANDQELVNQFLQSPYPDTQPIIDTLRDVFWMGWPDQPMLDFFLAVWMRNQELPPTKHLRIVLVDMYRPWDEITEKSEWKRYSVNRDLFMADKIIKEMKTNREDKRHALFIVGVGHAMLNFQHSEGSPLKSTGWYLYQQLGPQHVYSIFPHRPVMTNMERVDGRLCQGLFDEAFDEIKRHPLAFPLATGPWGKQFYHASPDSPTVSLYRDGYNAYLYLGPLEYEIFSPLIPNFYTTKFMKEVERRHRLMFGKGWAEAYSRKSDPETMIQWMSETWGKPRQWRNHLGPTKAWRKNDSK